MSASRPPHPPGEKELHDMLNYTLVALVGMLAGFIVGYLYGKGSSATPSSHPVPSALSR